MDYNKKMTKWKDDFKAFVNELQLPRDDYRGILEYVNEGYSIFQSSRQTFRPISRLDNDGWTEYFCGNCKKYLTMDNKKLNMKFDYPKYCEHCGAAVKWK